MITYKIATDSGPLTVSGEPVGKHLAVREFRMMNRSEWVVDHVPSGKRAAAFGHHEDAWNFAVALLDKVPDLGRKKPVIDEPTKEWAWGVEDSRRRARHLPPARGAK